MLRGGPLRTRRCRGLLGCGAEFLDVYIEIFFVKQRVHQYILNGTSTSPQSSSKNVLVTNPPVLFFLYWSVHQYTSPKHTWTSMWPKGEGQFSTRKIFKKFLGGWKIFPFRFLVNFDVFLVDFDAKTHMRGGKSAQNSKWGVENHHKDNPSKGGDKILGIF